MLEVKKITAAYGPLQVLHGMSLSVPEQTVVALLGGNGAGKSSTMKCITGLLPVKSGSIELDGKRIDRMKSHKICAQGIAMSPQHRELFPEMTVLENMELGGLEHGPSRELAERREQILEHFPRLRERRDVRAASLSGGEQQMLATGRALMSQPKVLLLDEPTAGLAPVMVKEILQIIRDLKAQGQTIFLVEQNVRVALQVADHVYIGRQGQVVANGPAASFSADDAMFRQYFGAV